MTPLLLPLTIGAFTLALPASGISGWRDRFLRAAVLFGACIVILTEGLGGVRLIRPEALLAAWCSLAAIAAASLVKRRRTLRFPPFVLSRDPVTILCIAAILAILTLTAVTAAWSPPNSADALAYHLPRVIYWAEQNSVGFFPTPYLNQIMLQPFAEYLMLHTYMLSGGDHFINFIQWFASLVSIVAVSGMAKLFGAGTRGQAIAALFCATLPSGILASSGAKNDYVLAASLATAVYFTQRYFQNRASVAQAIWPGVALGLALLTKATAYLFAPWVLLAIVVAEWRQARRTHVAAALGVVVLCAASLNAPQYARNVGLSGSILGFDSAQADGRFRWRNETFGWKPTASNAIRNLSEQLGARSERWRNTVFQSAVALHERLGIALNDPADTWPGSHFQAPLNSNHEADANNRWHLAILVVLALLLFWRAVRGRDRARALYAASLLFAFLTFCAYLKWQPFLARLFLPLFVLGAPLAAIPNPRRLRYTLAQGALGLLLLANCRSAVLENWVRPLTGPRSVLRVPRDEQYFADMSQWNNRASYQAAVNVLSRSSCRLAGIDINNLQLEYPLQALLREYHPRYRFLHTGVDNVSNRYPQPDDGTPCAIVCLDCAGDTRRLARYAHYPRSLAAGKFVILLGN